MSKFPMSKTLTIIGRKRLRNWAKSKHFGAEWNLALRYSAVAPNPLFSLHRRFCWLIVVMGIIRGMIHGNLMERGMIHGR